MATERIHTPYQDSRIQTFRNALSAHEYARGIVDRAEGEVKIVEVTTEANETAQFYSDDLLNGTFNIVDGIKKSFYQEGLGVEGEEIYDEAVSHWAKERDDRDDS